MWHVYNLIAEVGHTQASGRMKTEINQGDHVRALAIRKVQTVSSTGSSDSFRVRVNLELEVTKVRHASYRVVGRY